MGNDRAREEAERLLKESTARLQEMKDDKEAFKVSLELVGIDLSNADDALERGDSEASQREATQAVESMYANIRDVLDLAPAFATPESEATLRAVLDKVNNLRILAWQWGQRLRQEYEAKRDAVDGPACPAMIYEGVARLVSEMASPEATDFCLNRCKYQEACNPSLKQQYIPVAP